MFKETYLNKNAPKYYPYSILLNIFIDICVSRYHQPANKRMKEIKKVCDLKSCFLCRECMPEWLPAVRMHRKDFEVKKGGKIFSEGEPVSGMYFVYRGAIKVHKRWDTGKELIVRFAKPGDIIGYLGLGRENGYPVSATALETAIVCFVSMDFFNATLKVNPLLTIRLMHLFAQELELSQKSSRDLVHMPVKARIAQSFLALKGQFGTRDDGYLNINISRQDIASYSGTTYETVFKVINELAGIKAIKILGKNIRINDDQMLLSIIGKDNDMPEGRFDYSATLI